MYSVFLEELSDNEACASCGKAEHYQECISASGFPVEVSCEEYAGEDYSNTDSQDYPAEEFPLHHEEHTDTDNCGKQYHSV